MPRVAPVFAIPGRIPHGRSSVGNQYLLTQRHGARQIWYKRQYYSAAPFAVSKVKGMPRVLLDRSLQGASSWQTKNNNPDVNRWERLINSLRVTEDRWALVEEDGAMHKVNWKMYCQRLQTELNAAKDHVPQYVLRMKAVPIAWKKLEMALSLLRGLSVREASAQCKLSQRKGHQIVYRALEIAQQGAEAKGLDKEKLRLVSLTCGQGPTDKQIDIRSKGYHAWKTKRSSRLMVVIAEDPEMVLPDRTAIPFSSMLSLKRAGLREESTVLDVPAITAEGI
ncbi:ribosomal protein L22p/L17e, putative [Bodo saltans]|uniref:Ribosomal protein L22p/L17e, putative n=1 Tax=Bodo saltans TaxID=75058 RepID=A0A0S4KGN2_BODSA|nr:ribosomal protein L22p/L17e, putative [Bodo saltans]|eukprot:CUI14845.1 ribosomal protein L22p/L17e, putative [Bodo saltans]